MRRFLMICAALLCAQPPGATAQTRRPTAIAEALAMPTASGLTGAAEVPRFAWVENQAGARTIWTADAGGRARELTAATGDDGRDIYDLAFSRDGRRLAYVRGGDGEFPDEAVPNAAAAPEAPKQEVRLRALDGDEDRLLGEGHSPVFSRSGDRIAFTTSGELWIASAAAPEPARRLVKMPGTIRSMSWSGDGNRLLFVNVREDNSVIGLFDVATAELSYLDASLGRSIEPVFSPDGRRVAFVRYTEPPPGAGVDTGPYWSIRLVDLAGGSARTLWAAKPGAGARWAGTRGRNLFWSADDRLVFPWERDGWMHVYALPASGAAEPTPLTPGAFEVEAFLLGEGGRALIYAGNAGDIDRRHVWRVPLTGGPSVALTAGAGIESFPTVAGGALAVIATDADTPAHAALVGRARGTTPLADRAAAHAPAARYVAPTPVLLRADDGLQIHAQLFRARGPRAAGRRPALIFIHGGPRRQMLLGLHPSRYYSNAYVLNQHLAAQGYHVLTVNYRGGTGYGQAFREAPATGRGGASEYRDIRAAGLYLRGLPQVDASKIGLWGGSWGGYLTALGLARDSGLFAAGVDLHGVHDLVRTPPRGLSPEESDKARALMWTSSPMSALAGWRSPVLLIHGDDDRNVDFEQSVLLASALRARGIPHEELVFPNERHSFVRHQSWVKSFEATEAFFARTLLADPRR